MSYWLLLAIVFVISVIGTGVIRRYAMRRGVMDIPNARSSHSIPTPRGGGVAIVVAFLLGIVTLSWLGALTTAQASALTGAGLIVAVIGFVDDHRHIAARWRLLAHFVAAVWGLTWLGGLPPVELFGHVVSLGWAGNAIAAIALVWLLNLYNFMDGIDGLAGLEAFTVCVAAAAVDRIAPTAGRHVVLPALLAVAALGFLIWNFPPAKIFMGDAGSGFVGLMLGLLAVDAARISPSLLWSWLILLGVFVVDATMTLLRRLARRDRLYEAHRTHAYQHAALRRGHARVTIAAAAVNLLWLLPVALLVALGHLDGVLGVLIAYAPLVWLASRLGAGSVTR
jgi:Fuc2NAc and GlcNAc transferase